MKRRSTQMVNKPDLAQTRIRRWIEHPFGLPVLLFMVLVLVSGVVIGAVMWNGRAAPTITASENFIVLVNHDGQEQIVPTNEETVGAVLSRMHINVSQSDRVEPAADQPITGDNFRINVYRAAPVTIVDQSSVMKVKSAAATPRSVVAEAVPTLHAEDTVTAGLTDNFVLQKSLGYRAVVDRATEVQMQLYGQPITLRTHAKTVAALLKEKAVVLGKTDTVRPALTTAITPAMQIKVLRDGVQVVTIDETVAPPVQTVLDASLSFGSQAVRQEGVPGKVTNTYEITIENGDETKRRLIQSVKVSEPVPRIIAKGNTSNVPADKQAVMAAAGISASDYAYVDYIFSRESHWNTAAVSSNGYYGLGQTNLTKLSSACPNWQTDAVCQTKLFSGYASRYGGWEGAYNFWTSHHWW